MKAITIIGIVFLVVGTVTLMFSGFPSTPSRRRLSLKPYALGACRE